MCNWCNGHNGDSDDSENSDDEGQPAQEVAVLSAMHCKLADDLVLRPIVGAVADH